MRKAVIFDRCYIKQNSRREIPAMPALRWHPRKDVSFEIGERYPAPLRHVAGAVKGWPEAQGKRLRLHPLKAVSLLALVLRVSWGRGVPTLKLCVLLCVFADVLPRALSPANSKTGLKNFTELKTKQNKNIFKKSLLKYPFAAEIHFCHHQRLQGTGQQCSVWGAHIWEPLIADAPQPKALPAGL